MNTVKEDVSPEYFLGALIKTSVLNEVSSCYTARELSIRYVFIERKRGDEEIFRADILFDSTYTHRNPKFHSVPCAILSSFLFLYAANSPLSRASRISSIMVL